MTDEEDRTEGHGRRKSGVQQSSVQVLDRSLALLGRIAERDGSTLSGLAAQTGMAPSTVHRLLTSLAEHRMVTSDAETGVWTVGVKAFEIGNAFRRGRKLEIVARPFLKALSEETGETANIGIEDEGEIVFVAQVESHAPIRAFFRPGRRGPIHASGIGKAILSTWADAAVARRMSGRLTVFTEKTHGGTSSLLSDLQSIRSRGYAIDDEEHTAGMRCIAAPVYEEHGETLAGLSVSGPTVRLCDARIEELGQLVRSSADALTAALGGRRPEDF
ncbi:IclR family transcriptional regulator [Pararhizobium haloflavum]|uniref:IclR family transcriptional regulator n=1 Tax=Pararhizobium haloflavum TaxID=2037914 RepID=UPI000C19ED1B|nr:IclR family transcriptional regulator [Pararhizobium haloflavum]